MRTRPLLLAAALLAGTVVPLAAPAVADSGPVPLGMTSFADIVVDEAHGQLFLSPGRSGSGVRVTDLSGGNARTVDGLSGAAGMALTPDGRSLWVALPTAGLARIDTATRTVAQHVPLPTGVCAGDVAVVGTQLVYGHACGTYGGGTGRGGIGVVDAATGTSLGAVTGGPSYRPVVAAGPGGRVYAAEAGLSPTGLFAYDVTGAAPVQTAWQPEVCSNLRDLSVSPDGSQVVTACGHPYQHTVWTAGLSLSGSYASGPHPLAGAWSADGSTFVAGIDSAYEPDVVVHRLGENAPVRWADFGATTSLLQPRGLAVSRDGTRVWAVASTSSTDLALHVLDVPALSAASLTATAEPRAMYPGGTATVTGRLATPAGGALPGEVLRVSRGATGEVPVALPSVTTGADGAFAFTDVPPSAGSYTYAVSRPSDGAWAEAPVLVWSTAGRLELSLASRATTATPVSASFRLSFEGPDSPAGVPVTVQREAAGAVTTVGTSTTDANGGGTFTDAAPAGPVRYRATAAAQGVHPASSATLDTTVLNATSLTAKTPSSAYTGSQLEVSGLLRQLPSYAGVAGASLSVQRSNCGTTTGWSGTAVTAADGSWAVSDPSPPVGVCRYTASYAGAGAGGGWYAPATSQPTTTTVDALRPTAMTVTAPDGAVAGSTLTITGALTSGTSAVAGAAVTLTRSGCSTAWAATTTTGIDGSWSVADQGVPGGTCTWTASSARTATHEASSGTAGTFVAFKPTSLTLSAVRGKGGANKQVTLTAQLTSGSPNRTVVLTAQPSGGAETVVLTKDVDSTGRVTATHPYRAGTTYRARYAGDAYSATAEAVKVL